ncbi:MAG TPA: hypothetical protein VGD58_09015, partial [Herpetosiphonaceae bacterium]
MSDQSVATILRNYISGARLDLPVNKLGAPAIQEVFARFLPGENLVIDPITTQAGDATAYTVAGTGQNRLFRGMHVSVTVRAGTQLQILLTADATSTPWALATSFPKLADTLASALQFKQASWRLASSAEGSQPPGLSFKGTLDISSSLGLFVFLLGESDETLTGNVESITRGIPVMRLDAGAARVGKDLHVIKLGSITLALSTETLPPVRQGGPFQARVSLHVGTSLTFTAQGKPVAIPLSASIGTGSSAIRLTADPSSLVSAGLEELGALLNSVSIKGLSYGDFKLEDQVKLTELELVVDPLGTSKINRVGLRLQSTQQWDLLKRANGLPLCSVQNIHIQTTLRAPFSADGLMLALYGEVVLNNSRIVLQAILT